MSKVIVVTGISGSGSKEFCNQYSKIKGEEGKKVKVYHTGEMIYELAKQAYPFLPKQNLLNLHPTMLANLRDEAFDAITDNLDSDRKKYERIIIDTHAQFFWSNIYQNAYDWKYLGKIPADMFVTVIDKPSGIKEQQLKTEEGRAQKHDLRDLLLWQNVEVNVTEGWAKNYGKPMYVLARKQNPNVIDSLVENAFLIYSSFPMTDAASEANRKILKFKSDLRELRKEIDGIETPVIDPAYVDVETENINERERETIDAQTVHRDLNWSVKQSTHVVAYYPDEKVSLSKGVSDEIKEGMETGKFVYVIFPRERRSPFTKNVHGIFKNEDEFFEFFKEQMKADLERFKRK